jgi:hypothetical protein
LSACGGGSTSSSTSVSSQCSLENDAECIGADLSGQDLSGRTMVGIDLRNANLANATFVGADLTQANLVGADLTAQISQGQLWCASRFLGQMRRVRTFRVHCSLGQTSARQILLKQTSVGHI